MDISSTVNRPITERTYDIWMWIELIGFDNESPDFGVQSFLDRAGFVPEVISFLICNPDFVHTHDGMQQDYTLQPDCCSYGGHARNEERSRQSWTRYQLRDLVRQLQKQGIAVYLSFFDFVRGEQWTHQHPELRYVLRTGETPSCLCPWKRLADGTYYEDFLKVQLSRVMQDYGFDGLHGADGYNQPRIPIYDGDFSDDMVGQFLCQANIKLPPDLRGTSDANADLIPARADYIWQTRRLEYIQFSADRIQQFWRKLAAAMHAIGKPVFLNSAWTRDPFEAVYRYGTDYRKLADAGIDGFVVEGAATALEALEENLPPLRYVCDFMASALLNSACVPELPMRWLHGIKDTEENWHALRQAPTALECEIHSMSSLYRWDGEGDLQRCYRGLVTCLSDGLGQHDWDRLKQGWDLAFSETPHRLATATVVWSAKSIEPQLVDFVRTRRWPVQQFLRYLIAMGAPVSAVADSADLGHVSGPILAINLHLWSAAERERVFNYANGPIVAIAHPDVLPSTVDCRFEDPASSGQLVCAIIGNSQGFQPSLENVPNSAPLADVMTIKEPPSWLDELCFEDVSATFLANCVAAITAAVPGPRVIRVTSGHAYKSLREPRTVALKTITTAPGAIRLIVRNDNPICVAVRIDVAAPIRDIQWRNPFTAAGVTAQGSEFTVKAPGRGISILDLEIANSDWQR
jgi:hypothetical protein